MKPAQLYPNRWKIPHWTLESDPFPEEGKKHLGALLRGPNAIPERLYHVESGRTVRLKERSLEGEVLRINAQGLMRGRFRAGDRLLDPSYPVVWHEEGIFLPQGAMNRGWDREKGALMGFLVRRGGIPVHVRTLQDHSGKRLLHVRCRGVSLLPGAAYWLEHGDQRVDLALLAAGPFREKDEGLLLRLAFRFPGLLHLKAYYAVNLRLRGWVVLPPELYEEAFEDSQGEGAVRVMERSLRYWLDRLSRAARRPGGLVPEEVQADFGLPPPVGDFLLGRLEREGRLVRRMGRYEPPGDPRQRLSLYARTVLRRLEARGEGGLKASTLKQPLERRGLEELVQAGLAVRLEEDWHLAAGVEKAALLKLRQAGRAQWDLPSLRGLLPDSRAYLVALIHHWEAKGVLRPEDGGWRLEP